MSELNKQNQDFNKIVQEFENKDVGTIIQPLQSVFPGIDETEVTIDVGRMNVLSKEEGIAAAKKLIEENPPEKVDPESDDGDSDDGDSDDDQGEGEDEPSNEELPEDEKKKLKSDIMAIGLIKGQNDTLSNPALDKIEELILNLYKNTKKLTDEDGEILTYKEKIDAKHEELKEMKEKYFSDEDLEVDATNEQYKGKIDSLTEQLENLKAQLAKEKGGEPAAAAGENIMIRNTLPEGEAPEDSINASGLRKRHFSPLRRRKKAQ